MKRVLITIALVLPGSMWLAFAADLGTWEHVGIVVVLFMGGLVDGKYN